MNTFLKILSVIILSIGLIACQGDDSSEQTQEQMQQPQQQPSQQDQQNPLGQMQQQQAPDIDVSDKEAEKFVDAAMNVQEIQMQNQQKMIGLIEDEGLDVETFQKIAEATRTGKSTEDISDSDMEKFESASKSIQEAQGDVQKKIPEAIEEAGMKVERFQQISMATQQDAELRKQLQEKMQKRMGQQGGQGGQ